MSSTVSLTGFRELEAVYAQLANPTARKASARRALRKSAEPMAATANGLAPNDTSTEGKSIEVLVGTRLSRRQARQHRRMFRDDRAAVEMFVGAAPHPASWNQEFGNRIHAAQPYLRPAWDQDRAAMLEQLGRELAIDIHRTVARAERRAAQLAARGQ
ncbi:HK97 gp10 family phage protein [Pararhodobacter zhoushanensis]|uniref:HK97 gp10 family phage protein n=1 Tax=Pararhodobacter zhoushanensis TaxID=2479545 RepID=UPI000F8DBCD5|nr:HK97 gp10 family phage protein [Pararhodobacter zhoushanensis]